MPDTSLYSTDFNTSAYAKEVSHNDLARALVMFCIQDGNIASEDISGRMTKIQTQLSEFQEKLGANEENMPLMMEINGVLGEVNEALMSLQFFDRITQRMEHAIATIEGTQSTQDMRKRFTMEDERVLFDALTKGANLNQAVNIAKRTLVETIQKKGEDIELF